MQQQTNITSPVLVWITNNQRIQDNRVLKEAIATKQQVIALYCFDKRIYNASEFGFKKIEGFRAKFIHESITALKQSLEEYNISIFTYFDEPEKCISAVCDRYDIKKIYVQKEWTKEECDALDRVKNELNDAIEIVEIYDQFLFHPEDIPFEVHEIPEVFTNFRKVCEKRSSVRLPIKIDPLLPSNKVTNDTLIPTLRTLGFEPFDQPAKSAFPYNGGEDKALKRLDYYFFDSKKLGYYKKTRNGLLGTDYSSKFSAWLANGNISARTIYYKVREFEKNHYKNQSTYWLIFELIWRDFFKYVSLKHGNRFFLKDGIKQRDYEWLKNKKAIQQWIHGETAEPFVNANMIELKETGWMSNRGRQNVASYFAKTMRQDWRIGAAYFESVLIDYDVHSNYGNWQYVAGVGNDPLDRVFNVNLQAQRYDANGKYQRTWLQKNLF